MSTIQSGAIAGRLAVYLQASKDQRESENVSTGKQVFLELHTCVGNAVNGGVESEVLIGGLERDVCEGVGCLCVGEEECEKCCIDDRSLNQVVEHYKSRIPEKGTRMLFDYLHLISPLEGCYKNLFRHRSSLGGSLVKCRNCRLGRACRFIHRREDVDMFNSLVRDYQDRALRGNAAEPGEFLAVLQNRFRSPGHMWNATLDWITYMEKVKMHVTLESISLYEGMAIMAQSKSRVTKYRPKLWVGDLELSTELRIVQKDPDYVCYVEKQAVDISDDRQWLNDKRLNPSSMQVAVPMFAGKSILSRFIKMIQFFDDLRYIEAFSNLGREQRQKLLFYMTRRVRDGHFSGAYAALCDRTDKGSCMEQEVFELWKWRNNLKKFIIQDHSGMRCPKGVKRLLCDKVGVMGQTGIFSTLMSVMMPGVVAFLEQVKAFGTGIVEAFKLLGGYFVGKFKEWRDWFGKIIGTLNWSLKTIKYVFRFVLALIVIVAAWYVFKTWSVVKAIGKCTSQILWGVDPGCDTLDDDVQVLEAQGAKELAVGLSFLVSMVVGEGISARTLGSVFQITNSSKPFMTDLVENCSYAFDYVYFKVTGDHTWLYKTLAIKFITFKNDLTQWDQVNPNWRVALLSNTKLIDEIVEHHKIIKDIQMDALKSSNCAPQLITIINQLEKEVKDRMDFARTRNPEKGRRTTPACVVLLGDPGQGKTTIAQALTCAVYNYVRSSPNSFVTEPYSEHQCWAKASNTDYWDTYSGNWTLHIPELNAVADVKTRGEQGAELLNIIDNAPMPLNFSGVADKGIHYMKSRMVIITTNFEDFNNCGMTDKGAVMRRMHFPVRVTQGKRIDMSKPATQAALDSAWKLERLDELQGTKFTASVHEDLTFTDLVKRVGDFIIAEEGKLAVHRLAEGVNWDYTAMQNNNLSRSPEVAGHNRWFEEERRRILEEYKPVHPVVGTDIVLGGVTSLGEQVQDMVVQPPSPVVDQTETWYSSIVSSMKHLMPTMSPQEVDSSVRAAVPPEEAEEVAKSLLGDDPGSGVGKPEGQIWGALGATLVSLYAVPAITYASARTYNRIARWWCERSVVAHFPRAHNVVIDIKEIENDLIIRPTCSMWTYSLERDWWLGRMTDNPLNGLHEWDDVFDCLEYLNLPIVQHVCKFLPKNQSWNNEEFLGLKERCLFLPSDLERLTDFEMRFLVNCSLRDSSKLTNDQRARMEARTIAATNTSCSAYYETTGFIPSIMGVLTGVGVFAALASVIWGITLYCGEAEGESMSKETMVKMKKMRHRDNPNRNKVAEQRSGKKAVIAQASVTLDKKSEAIFSADKYFRSIEVIGPRGTSVDTKALVSGHVVFITRHVNFICGGVERVNIRDDAGSITQSCVVLSRTALDHGDQIRLNLDPRYSPAFASVAKRLRYKSDPKLSCAAVRVTRKCQVSGAKIKTALYQVHGDAIVFTESVIPVFYEDFNGNRKSLEAHDYYKIVNCPGRGGDCGYVYVALTSETRDILGTHFAGLGHDSYCSPIYVEDLGVEGQCGYLVPAHLDFIEMPVAVEKHNMNGMERELALVKPKFLPTDTVFHESKLHSAMDEDGLVTVAPAHLTFFKNSKDELIDPHLNAFLKYKARLWPTDWSLISDMVAHPYHYWKGFGNTRRKLRFLTLLEALNGIPGMVDSLTQNASVTCDFPGMTREQLWNREGWVNPLLQKRVEDMIALIDTGNDVATVAEACFKDELRPLDRVEGGATRLFLIVSLITNIICKMFVGDLVNELKTHRSDGASAVGINPFGSDWQEFWYYLNEISGNGFFGADCSGWDISVLFPLHMCLWDYLCAQYQVTRDSREGIRLRWVSRSVLWCLVLYGRLVLKLGRGIPSGHWLTSFMNSFLNWCIHQGIFRWKRPDHKLKFKDHVRLRVYGDDNQGKASDEVAPWYNMFTLRDGFRDYFGMRYTTPNKGEVVSPFLDPNDLQFLSRSFRCLYQDGVASIIVAPLDRSSIYGMIAWLRKSNDVNEDEMLRINLKNACMEMSLHGENEYMAFARQVYGWSELGHVRVYIRPYQYWEQRLLSSMHEVESTMTENWNSEDGMEGAFAQSSISTQSYQQIKRELPVCGLPGGSCDAKQITASKETLSGDVTNVDVGVKGLTDLELEETMYSESQVKQMFKQFNHQRNETLLGREYRVHTITFTIGTDTTAVFNPPGQLYTQADAVAKIKGFYEFMRWKHVHVRMVVRSLPQQYGFMTIAKHPYKQENSSMFRAKGAVVLSLNDQDAYEYDLPWVWPNDWIRVDDESIDNMWPVTIDFRNTDKVDSSVSNDVYVECYASFYGVEFAGPRNFTTVPFALRKGFSEKAFFAQKKLDETRGFITLGKQKEKGVEGQSGLPLHQGDLPGEGRVGVRTVSASMAAIAGGVPLYNAVKSGFDAWYGDDDELDQEFEAQGEEPARQEGVVLSTHGNTSNLTNVGSGNNLDIGPDIGRQDPRRFGDVPVHLVKEALKYPMLVLEGKLSTLVRAEFTLHPTAGTVHAYSDIGYLAFMSQYFRRWRGSLRMLLKMTTSSFVSARLQVAVQFGGETPGASFAGNLTAKILTIKGNEDVCWEIPFYRQQRWAPTSCANETGNLPRLQIQILSIASMGDRTPAIPFQLWLSVGDDFVFDGYQLAAQPNDDPPFGVEAQCDIRSQMHTTVQPLPGFALSKPEKWELSFEDLLKRWSNGAISEVTAPTWLAVPRIYALQVGYHRWNWDTLAGLFLFNSGSVRHKLFTEATTGHLQVTLGIQTSTSTGEWRDYPDSAMVATDVSKWPIVDFSCPFVAGSDFDINPNSDLVLFFDQNFLYQPKASDDSEVVSQHWRKAGANFQIFLLQPPPDKILWSWNNTYVPP